MSNLGFLQAMEQLGITVVQTAVGDRYVLEAMQAGGYVLGGEQSGHVIMASHATTGDGLLTALHVQRAAGSHRAQHSPSWPRVMTRLPQVLVNVSGVDKSRADSHPDVVAAVAEAQNGLGRGRPGAAPPVGHRVAGPGHGRGTDRRAGRRRRTRARRRGRTGPVAALTARAELQRVTFLQESPACRAETSRDGSGGPAKSLALPQVLP